MWTAWLGLALSFFLGSLVCFGVVLVQAFRLGTGPGFMVLLIPGYNLYYGFAQFQHRHKGWILAGWLGLFGLGVMARAMAFLAPG